MNEVTRTRLDDPLVERDRELEWLDRVVIRLIEHGDGETAIIEGPAGIGKSRLLLAATRLARERGAHVLAARGAEIESQLAFGAVRQILTPALDDLDPAGRHTVLRGPAGTAARILDPGRPSDEAVDTHYGLARLVANLAERRPVIIAVDDVQWLDDASASFLAYLAPRVAGQPICLLATHRPDPARTTLALSELTRSASVLRPRVLSRDGVRRLLEGLLEVPQSDDLAAACLRATGGMPFLVEEVGRALADVPPNERIREVERVAPASVGRAVLDRIRKLPGAAGPLAETVALFPAGARLVDAAAVAGIDPRVAALAADALVETAVFAPGAPLAFLHPVMQAAVYEQLGLFGRRQAHARAAEVLLARAAGVEEVADQLLVAEPASSTVYLEILETAATRAEAAGATGAAIRYLARALEEPPPAERRGDILARLGHLQLITAATTAEDTLRRALADMTSARERVDVSIDLASAHLANGHADDAAAVLLRARDDAATLDRERVLTVDALLASAAWESSRFGEQYAAIADGLPRDLPGTTPGERLVLTQVANRMFDRCEPHDRVRDVVRLVVGANTADERSGSLEQWEALHLLISCGALDDAEAICRRWERQARAAGPEALYVTSQGGLARIDWFRGEIRACEAVVRLALELPGGKAEVRAGLAAWMASVRTVEGAFDEARRWLDEAERHGASFGVTSSTDTRRAAMALAEGHPNEAVALLERAHAELVRRGSTNPAEATWVADLVEALAATGRREEALAVGRDTLERAERFGERRPVGLILLALGRSTSGDEGRAYLERAVDTLSSSPYRHDEARARLELGAALRRANRRSDARPHLRHALDYAHRNRLGPLASRANDELLAAGGRPRRRALVGLDALTPSELRIARLAARDMTNREIATHLFLTVKTVETHLASVFGKLEVTSRRHLARFVGPAT